MLLVIDFNRIVSGSNLSRNTLCCDESLGDLPIFFLKVLFELYPFRQVPSKPYIRKYGNEQRKNRSDDHKK